MPALVDDYVAYICSKARRLTLDWLREQAFPDDWTIEGDGDLFHLVTDFEGVRVMFQVSSTRIVWAHRAESHLPGTLDRYLKACIYG